MVDQLILASQSPFRMTLLKNAGLSFKTEKAAIDERIVEKESGIESISLLARHLAEAKALDVSRRFPTALVIGCDQTLEFEGKVLHKVATMEEAHRRLLLLSGKSHYLHSGIALAKNGEIIWNTVSTAILTMRPFSSAFVGRHLARVGSGVLQSVGAYQIEGEGVQLFETIEGDYFTIIGLPLLPLLNRLRTMEVIDG